MNENTIADALRYYDESNENFKNLRNKIKYIDPNPAKSSANSVSLTFYDADRNELFTSKIEHISRYYSKLKLWVWGWSIPNDYKYLTKTVRNIFLYGTDIDGDNNISNTLLKNELITSRFRIDNDIQLEIHCAIASYLAKKPFILAIKDYKSKIINKHHSTRTIKIVNTNGDQENDPDDSATDNPDDDPNEIIYYLYIMDTPQV